MPNRSATRTFGPQPVAPPAAPHDPSEVDQKWSNILASLDDAVILADTAEQVTFVNPAAENLTGFSAAQMCARPLADLFHDNGWIIEMIRGTLDTGQGRRNEGALTDSRRAQRAVVVATSPVLDARGAVDGAIVVLHDVSYRKDLEEASRHADRLAALELLSMGLAHEIKNPLSAIKGAAQLLQQAHYAGSAAIKDHTAVIVREVDRLTRLLDELANIAQPPPLPFAPVNIHKVLDAVLELARQRPEWRATTVRLQFDPSLPEVRASEDKLVQVFLNLVLNAVEAMGGEGTLTISTRMVTEYHVRGDQGARARFLSVDIEDSGPGISPADAARLFAPFFTTKPGGTGLGLAICQQIVTQHSGRIWVRAGRRGGALARVRLPVAVTPPQP